MDGQDQTQVQTQTPQTQAPQQTAAPVSIINEKGEFSENWRNALPDDLKTNPAIGGFKDLQGVLKSYVNAQKMIGANKIVLPGPNATPEERAEFFSKIGRPESPDKYDFKKPENLPDGMKYNEETEKVFRSKAHELGLTGEQAKALLDWHNGLSIEAHQKGIQNRTLEFSQAEAALKKEWGNAYEQKLARANAAVRTFGMKDVLEKKGLANDPEMVKAFAAIGESMSEDKLIGDSSALTPSDAISQVNAILGDSKNPYHLKGHPQHEEMVKKVAGLYAQAYPQS